MTCDLCGKNEATVHLKEVVNDQSRELHLCQACAQEKGAQAAEQFGLADLLAGLTDFEITPPGVRARRQTLSCSACGLSFEQFRKSGRLGCGACYTAFREALAPLLKRIHGSTRHVGMAPTAGAKPSADPETALAQLRDRLKAAVSSESFEEAAALRDQIRALEAKGKRPASFPRKRESGET